MVHLTCLIIVSGALDLYLSNLKGAQRGDLRLNKSILIVHSCYFLYDRQNDKVLATAKNTEIQSNLSYVTLQLYVEIG